MTQVQEHHPWAPATTTDCTCAPDDAPTSHYSRIPGISQDLDEVHEPDYDYEEAPVTEQWSVKRQEIWCSSVEVSDYKKEVAIS